MNLFFKNIRVINPSQDMDAQVNLWVKDGVILHCSPEDAPIDSDAKVIDGSSLVCAPGFLDMHVHLREPGEEYKETIKSGTDSAANGGFTGVVCMPNTTPTIDDLTVVEYIKSRSKDLLTDVHISAAITKGREGKYLTPMLELADAGVVMFTDDGHAVDSSEVMKRAFDYAATRDLLISQHCEDHALTSGFAMHECHLSFKLGLRGYPSMAEDIIVSRDLMISEHTGNRRYHVQHISTKRSIDLVRQAKAKGLRVTCEATPHHFTLNYQVLSAYNTNHKMNPPLRGDEDLRAVIAGLADGTIDCIATDHAPHALHEKEVEYENAPCGIIGLETAIGLSMTNLVHAGFIDMKTFIEKFTVNPRKIMGMEQVVIEKDAKANLTIFAPNEEWIVDVQRFKTNSLNTPFNGIKLKGKPKYAINNGKCFESAL